MRIKYETKSLFGWPPEAMITAEQKAREEAERRKEWYRNQKQERKKREELMDWKLYKITDDESYWYVVAKTPSKAKSVYASNLIGNGFDDGFFEALLTIESCRVIKLPQNIFADIPKEIVINDSDEPHIIEKEFIRNGGKIKHTESGDFETDYKDKEEIINTVERLEKIVLEHGWEPIGFELLTNYKK